ncbi:hypothetical protein [Pelagovum pacificum]|uniref:DUF2244 domain-containing protein n=1 Tax=Pelagovum pacificum TaxID=2588711 RepID=A0A5C5GBB6_9RHOB|nr:hypothetical protein [Pelagovum pacificum]QQA41253.1 hypothetical protein I8N54_10460 [Pelagovum pacificum]TNY31938.1 hypothetical protein FHY64_01135 [Pelagovum pacificum]
MSLTLARRKSGSPATAAAPLSLAEAPPAAFELDETYWGYVIRAGNVAPVGVMIAQGMSWFLGLGAALGALAIWLLPDLAPGIATMSERLGASGLLVGLSALLFWFASRGSRPELQVDRRQREVREVVRCRAGQARLVARYDFDEIGGVHLDRTQMRAGHARLVLRYRNTAQTLPVAAGQEAALVALRDRLGADLMG